MSDPTGARSELEALLREMRADWRELDDLYNRDGVHQDTARQIERIFDRWNHERKDELEAALASPPAVPQEPPETHRCSGCGHRWLGPLKGATLCGECWRKGQRVILGYDVERPPTCRNCGCPGMRHPSGSPSPEQICACGKCPAYAPWPAVPQEPQTCPWCGSASLVTWPNHPGLYGCRKCVYRWRPPSTSPSAECSPDHPARSAVPQEPEAQASPPIPAVLVPVRLREAIQAVILATRGFKERKQEIWCKWCRYKDPIGSRLHDPECPV